MGELTALHLAGAFDFETGLRLVQLRGQAMQEAAERVSSGMVALIGADEQQANHLCAQVLDTIDEGILVPANFNCPGQVVVSGSLNACETAVEVAKNLGLMAKPLSVAGAFHSPIMEPAAERFRSAIDEVQWQPTRAPVLSNVTADPHDWENFDTIKDRLVKQLTHPVRWTQCVQWLHEHVSGRYVELAPGRVLSGLMKKIDRQIKVTNFMEPTA